MTRKEVVMALILAAAAASTSQAQGVDASYAQMAPADAYLIANRSAEVALARSAAPESISARAEVMVLGRNGYEVAVPGTNHFVCLVERSWDAAIGAPQFWNPKIRGPDCFNPAAVSSYLPIVLMKTRLALAGKTQAQIDQAVRAAFSEGKLPPVGVGAMSYMMSKQGFLNDQAGNWHPHLMFFVPLTLGKSWGANLPGSPVLSSDDAPDRLTIYMIPVARWSDGTLDSRAGG